MRLIALSRMAGRGRRWLIGGAGVAALVLVVAAWSFAGQAAGQEAKAPAVPGAISVKAARAETGVVSAALTYSGDVRSVSAVTVVSKATGRVEALKVDVGSKVKAGDVIAQLEAGGLKTQVGQAQAGLEVAQAKLGSLESGARPEQVAQARANVESARARLSGMSGGRAEQIAQAQAALEMAWANREQVRRGANDADRQGALGAVDAASANLQTARARLETVKIGPTQAEWGSALGAQDAARAGLAAAQIRLTDAKAGPKADVIKAAEAAVVSAKASLAAVDDLRELYDDRDSSVGATTAAAAAGATSPERISRQQAAAQANLEAAEARLDLLRRSPLPAELEQLQAAVDVARAGVLSAEYRVEQLKRGATSQDLTQAEAGVSAAEAALSSARARVRQIDGGATEEQLWVVDSAVKQAEQAVALATMPYREEDVAQAQAGATAAEQGLLLAMSPYTRYDLAMAQATVRQAEAALSMSELALAETVVVSPVDGVVSEKMVSPGALVGPQSALVSVISPEVELVLGVEEAQVGSVREGQTAEVSVAAYPERTFLAKVALVAPAADAKSRTFQVRVRPVEQDGKLKGGMFAQVRLVSQEKVGAVLVPKEAVASRSGKSVVFVLTGDAAQMRPVTLGLSSGGKVEVTSGVSAGEEVAVAGAADLRDGDRVKRS